MDRDTWIYAGLGALAFFIVWQWGNPVVAAQLAEQYVTNIVGRGNQLSYGTLSGGVVDESPDVLATMAEAVLGFPPDRDTLALARMGRSEGVDGMEYRMHVVLNDIADLMSRGLTAYDGVEKYLTYSRNAAANGHFSTQALGKRASSSHDPFEADYQLAQKVIADHDSGIDPTNGATKFVDKSGPFYVDGQKTDYAGLVAAWAADGLSPMNLPGATTNFVVFVKGLG